MYIRNAVPQDLETIVRWRHEAAAWLADRGSDQWSSAGLDDETFRRRVSQSIKDGETWMAVTDSGSLVGTIALDHVADGGLWDDETLRRSLVIHRMIIDRSATGQGVGEFLLRHAEQLAVEHGLEWLILDAWTSNNGLHEYYRRQGFEHVRTVPGFPSGALFQRKVHHAALPDDLERRFREHRVRMASAVRILEHPEREIGSTGPDVEHAAVAAEHRTGADLYREAAGYVASPLLIEAVQAAADRADVMASAHERSSQATSMMHLP